MDGTAMGVPVAASCGFTPVDGGTLRWIADGQLKTRAGCRLLAGVQNSSKRPVRDDFRRRAFSLKPLVDVMLDRGRIVRAGIPRALVCDVGHPRWDHLAEDMAWTPPDVLNAPRRPARFVAGPGVDFPQGTGARVCFRGS